VSWQRLIRHPAALLACSAICCALGIVGEAPLGGGVAKAASPVRSMLPTPQLAKRLLNATHRHGEWLRVPAGSQIVLAWTVYPVRSDPAPVVLTTADDQQLSDWLRSVADQIALEGYIAVVPDARSSSAAAAAVREYAAALPSASGVGAELSFVSSPAPGARIDIRIDRDTEAGFELSARAWPQAIAFLDAGTGNDAAAIETPLHGAHWLGQGSPSAPGEAPPRPRGYPISKPDHLVAGYFNARSTVETSPMRSEWVDVPVDGVPIRTRIVYPQGDGEAPIVIAMQHGTGLDDWMLALADQLAREGFIAIAPDMHSGLGPDGGNTDSFAFIDDVMKANVQISTEFALRRFEAAYDHGMGLPRASGKAVSIGFCRGGGHSFEFAATVPLDAAVVFYGNAPEPEIMARINAPVIGFYGEDDARITSGVEAAAAEMRRLGKAFEHHIYPHATHVFLEFQDLGGNAEAVAHAWPRAMEFIREHTELQ
jgi:carboxymethylenebutenolidase